ncbi:unnamed protein product [Eruca vesicaria subsp. sativa]|uniref:Uncharacterized protein n=1 Tax=Eruca vesicaria subsp. sativa TaxID=29727 RepID=A0ABC8LWE8_ERUVS|nr:unnamed protein product [Eruca vesicaria subsp. sativa]
MSLMKKQAGSSGTTPTNVQFRFTIENQVESPINTRQRFSEGTSTYTLHQAPSPNIDFTNYFESGRTSERPGRGGPFNICGNTEESNERHQSDSGNED